MTVRQLIACLETMPPDALALVDYPCDGLQVSMECERVVPCAMIAEPEPRGGVTVYRDCYRGESGAGVPAVVIGNYGGWPDPEGRS